MRFVSLIAVLFFPLLLFSQQPQGKLYFYTGNGGLPTPYLGYLEYPGASYHFVDSIQLRDIAMVGDKLHTASFVGVVIYDTSTNLPVDTISHVYPQHLAAWGDKLAVTSVAPLPYFQVFDEQRELLFSLDSSKVTEIPSGLVVSGDTAFLLLQNDIVVVDLLLQDTIAIIPTPHPLAFAGDNAFVVDDGAYLYIDVEYATGAIRFSLMRMNKTTFDVDTVFHSEGYANFNEPVVAGDKIYLLPFNSYYDIPLDSLFISANPWWPQTVEYDAVSGALFLNNDPGNKLTYFLNGNFSDTATVAGYISQTLFVPEGDTLNSVSEITEVQRVYPNPANGYVRVDFGKEINVQSIELYNATGMRLSAIEIKGATKTIQLKTALLPEGLYFLKILTDKNFLSCRFVK